MLFEESGMGFVLDIHTNRLFRVSGDEYRALDMWNSGVGLEETAVKFPAEVAEIRNQKNKGIFASEPFAGLAFGMNWNEISYNIINRRESTVLELTQQCNLRCRYCTFGGGFSDHRTHSDKFMTRDTTEKAIEQAFRHNQDLDEIRIGFYGGEPLLAWPMLTHAVDLTRNLAGTKKVHFSLTTNGTLLDEKKAAFLYDHEFTVLVSIDGPASLHDHYRVFPDGSGSYAHAIRGLKFLLDAYGNAAEEKIALSMVVPSGQWMRHIRRLWQDEPWLPKGIMTSLTVVEPPEGFQAIVPPLDKTVKSLRSRWLDRVKQQRTAEIGAEEGLFEETMAFIHQRKRFRSRRETLFPNGCCIPATRKVYVRVDGEYRLCERAHGVPALGNVWDGVNLERVKAVIDDYCHYSWFDCKDCPTASICKLCFAHAFKNGRLDMDKKREICKGSKQLQIENLKTYAFIAETYPEKLAHWDEVLIG